VGPTELPVQWVPIFFFGAYDGLGLKLVTHYAHMLHMYLHIYIRPQINVIDYIVPRMRVSRCYKKRLI